MAAVREFMIRWGGVWLLCLLVVPGLGLAACSDEAKVVDTTLETEAAAAETGDALGYNVGATDGAPMEYDLPRAEDEFTPAQTELVNRYLELNSNCRGGSGDAGKTWHECAKRDAMSAQMRRADLCYGKQQDASAADMTWHICHSDSLGFADPPRPVPMGRCRITTNGEALYEGRCSVSLQDGGSFWAMSANQRVFASVDRKAGDTALVDVEGRALPNGGDHGAVQRSGACWSNAQVEICAWN